MRKMSISNRDGQSVLKACSPETHEVRRDIRALCLARISQLGKRIEGSISTLKCRHGKSRRVNIVARLLAINVIYGMDDSVGAA